MGEYRAAARSLQRGIEICERLLPGPPEAMLRPVMFSLVFSHQQLSWTLWILGYPEQALHQIDRLHALPERLLARFQKAQILMPTFQTDTSFFVITEVGARGPER
jgi:hypothetical protein